ncbi:MAG: hypothetical protein AAF799_19690 [Myxococcota bacterium]
MPRSRLSTLGLLLPLALGVVSCDEAEPELWDEQVDPVSFRDVSYVDDPALDGPYCQMHEDFDRPESRTDPLVRGRIFWPVDCVAGMPIMDSPLILLDKAAGGLPVYTEESYHHIGNHLASHGFAVAVLSPGSNSIDHEWITERAQRVIGYLDYVFAEWPLAFALDADSIVSAGHSQGGLTASYTARLIHQQGLPYVVQAVIAMAPAYLESATFSHDASPFFMALYGSRDEDITGRRLPAEPNDVQATVFGQYDAIGSEYSPTFWPSVTKSMKFVHGWRHQQFSAPPTSIVSKQMKATSGYINAALRWRLWGQDEYKPWVTDNLVPPSTAGNWTPYTQYQDGQWQSRRVVDNFEGPTLETSTIGGSVSTFGNGEVLYGQPAYTLDETVPHGDTQVLVVQPEFIGEHLTWDIPANVQDMSWFDVLSVRAGKIQGYGLAGSVSLSFRIKSNGVWSDFVDSEDYVEIPEPDYAVFKPLYEPVGDYSKSPMNTVRIPLEAFDADVTDVEAVSIHYAGLNETGTRWMLDNLEFSK